MNDPRVLIVFTSIFLLLGLYNIVILGPRRLRESRERNRPIVWYKQINILTGIEYMLLAIVFLVSVSNRTGALPASMQAIIAPLYLILLLAAAIIAGFVIRQGITNARNLRAASTAVQSKEDASSNGTVPRLDRQQQSAKIQRQRERRRNAASARRRRAGRI